MGSGRAGVFHPKEVGPLDTHVPNGVVDIVAKDELHAVELAKQYLSYFQGRRSSWEAADQRVLRDAIPVRGLHFLCILDMMSVSSGSH